MTDTHPPGHPGAPTGPGRIPPALGREPRESCGSLDEHREHTWTLYGVFKVCGGEGGNTTQDTDPREAGSVVDAPAEAVVAAGVGPLPRLGEMIRDVERLLAQALQILGRPVVPASYPPGLYGHMADAWYETIGAHIEAGLRDLGELAALPCPPVGSAVPFPAVPTVQEISRELDEGRRTEMWRQRGVTFEDSTAAPVVAGEGPGSPPAPGAARGMGLGTLGPEGQR